MIGSIYAYISTVCNDNENYCSKILIYCDDNARVSISKQTHDTCAKQWLRPNPFAVSKISRKGRNILSYNSNIKSFDFHFSKSQTIVTTSPVIPLHAVGLRWVVASQVETVQVGQVAAVVPPATFERHCTMSSTTHRCPGLECWTCVQDDVKLKSHV